MGRPDRRLTTPFRVSDFPEDPVTYINDQAVIRQAWLTNFLLNRVMLQGGDLNEAVDVLFLIAGEGEGQRVRGVPAAQ